LNGHLIIQPEGLGKFFTPGRPFRLKVFLSTTQGVAGVALGYSVSALSGFIWTPLVSKKTQLVSG
jgi:hypothetical protein